MGGGGDGWNTCGKLAKECVPWIERGFGDCVCDGRSGASFALGLVSMAAWGTAEVPQIVTNFRAKACHGVSLALLLTWVFGDIFNLVGCQLEPVTLPTQYYTALLYTTTTLVLVTQTLYYNYILAWWRNRDLHSKAEDDSKTSLLKPTEPDQSRPIAMTGPVRSPPCSISDIRYISPRSLAWSGSPSFGSFLAVAQTGLEPRRPSYDGEDDRDDDGGDSVPALPRHRLPRSVYVGAFISSSASLPHPSSALAAATGLVGATGAKGHSSLGLTLGWLMAAIYMGGRLPQIYLNVRRGSVQGLNPLMFIFALVANATYVASILVRSTDWVQLKPNAPWLLDAGVCVLLDALILIQFVYYTCKQRGRDVEDAATTLTKEPLNV